MRNMSPAALDQVLREGEVNDVIGILEPGRDSGRIVGHYLPAGFQARQYGPGARSDFGHASAVPTGLEGPDLRLARMDMEIADAHRGILGLVRRLEGRSPAPRSPWEIEAVRRRHRWSVLLNDEETFDAN